MQYFSDNNSISRSIGAFLKKALPKSRCPSTLVVGESHDYTEHLKWLEARADQLRDDYHVSTFAVEMAAFQNIFLWAYKDGTLTRELGSQDAAERYLHVVLRALAPPQYSENADALADLIITCADKNIDVVAYDTRRSYQDFKKECASLIGQLHDSKAAKAAAKKGRSGRYFQELRDTLSYQFGPVHSNEAGTRIGWAMHEVEWLLGQQVTYQTKFDAIEHLVQTGLTAINHEPTRGSMSSDGLSACMLDALSRPEGNRIAVFGISHIDGVGNRTRDTKEQAESERTNGVFLHHLFSLHPDMPRRKHNVTGAVIAGIGVADKLSRSTGANAQVAAYMVESPGLVHLNIQTGRVEDFYYARKPLHDVKSFEELAPVYSYSPVMQSVQRKQFANPLFIPEIKRAVDAVKVAMFTHQQQMGL